MNLPIEALTRFPAGVSNDDQELAIAFFVAFSRVEQAMKRGKSLKGKKGKVAEADWDNLHRHLEKQLGEVDEPAIKEALDYLLNKPPKNQLVQEETTIGKYVEWTDDAYPGYKNQTEQTTRVFRLVRRVRNNLFHGGKWPLSDDGDDPLRRRELLKYSLTVLRTMVNLCPSIKQGLGAPDSNPDPVAT